MVSRFNGLWAPALKADFLGTNVDLRDLYNFLAANVSTYSRGSYSKENFVSICKSQISLAPYIIFLFCAFLCMILSATMHTFWIKSKKDCKCFLGLDFFGIATLVCGSTASATWYASLYLPVLRNIYVTLMVIFWVATVILTHLPIFKKNAFFNAALYFCQAAVAMIPLKQWLVSK